MKIINRKVHGFIDYTTGIFLIASPWLFNFSDSGYISAIPIILGAGTITYSLCTNYELGVFKAVSMKTHLVTDFAAGAFLAVSPWIFDFSDMVYLPHLIVGLSEMMVAMLTDASPMQQFQNDPYTD